MVTVVDMTERDLTAPNNRHGRRGGGKCSPASNSGLRAKREPRCAIAHRGTQYFRARSFHRPECDMC